jgi:hypothetical protein
MEADKIDMMYVLAKTYLNAEEQPWFSKRLLL